MEEQDRIVGELAAEQVAEASTKKVGEKKIIGRRDILELDDRPIELHEIPEWGGWLYFRGMTGAQRDRLEASVNKGEDKVDTSGLRARGAAYCIVHPDGTPMFAESDVVRLGSRSALALTRAWKIASRMSGMSFDEGKEIEGNSNGDPSADSTSA